MSLPRASAVAIGVLLLAGSAIAAHLVDLDL